MLVVHIEREEQNDPCELPVPAGDVYYYFEDKKSALQVVTELGLIMNKGDVIKGVEKK